MSMGDRLSVWKQLFSVALLAAVAVGGFYAYDAYFASHEEESASRGGARAVVVELGQAEQVTFQRTIEAVGTSRARQSVDVVPLASGRLVELAISPGQEVEKDAVLARLDDTIETADLAEAEAILVERRQAVERSRQLVQRKAVPTAALEEATADLAAAAAAVDRARRRLADRTIRAPFSGVVGLTNADLGARVDDETVLTTIDDLSEVEIEFAAPETLFSEIAIGQPVSARSAAFPGRAFGGEVSAIDSRIDPVSRSFKIRAVIPNPEHVLPAGMFMALTLRLSEAEVVAVPEEAVVVQAADTFVFVVSGDTAERRSVVTGQRRDGLIEIRSGLEEGEAVVIRGLQRVRGGSKVKLLDAESAADGAAGAKARSGGDS